MIIIDMKKKKSEVAKFPSDIKQNSKRDNFDSSV